MAQRNSRRSSERPIPFPEQILPYPCNQQVKTPASAMNVNIVTSPAIQKVRSAATIRIVCVSDTHFYHQHLDLPDGDILVHAGDFMAFGDMERHIAEFNQWLGQQPHSHKIVIAGNHDGLFESSPGVARALLTNAIYLENSGVELDGLRFWGSPVQPTFHEWAFKRRSWRPYSTLLGYDSSGNGCAGDSWAPVWNPRSGRTSCPALWMRRTCQSSAESKAEITHLRAYTWRSWGAQVRQWDPIPQCIGLDEQIYVLQ